MPYDNLAAVTWLLADISDENTDVFSVREVSVISMLIAPSVAASASVITAMTSIVIRTMASSFMQYFSYCLVKLIRNLPLLFLSPA